nr:hypothetical protein RAR13_11705 [Aminobacter aminovorans]
MTSAPTNMVEFGWGARPMKEQHPVLDEEVAAHFDKDNMAIIRLSVRGLITDSQKVGAFKKLTASIGKEIRLALQARATQ